MRSELETMRRRLDEADDVKARLVDRLGELGTDNRRLTTHIGSIESKVGTVESQVGTVQHQVVTVAASIDNAVGRSATLESVESLRDELVRLDALSERVDRVVGDLARQSARPTTDPTVLDDLADRLDDLGSSIAGQQKQIADVALVATDAAERSGVADSAVAELAERIDATPTRDSDGDGDRHRQLGQLAEKVTALDSRIHQISIELTNQLGELSADVDSAAGQRPDPAAIIDELQQMMDTRIASQIDDLTGGQERLANEQARYAIQFRQDLAELAERLRRPNTR